MIMETVCELQTEEMIKLHQFSLTMLSKKNIFLININYIQLFELLHDVIFECEKKRINIQNSEKYNGKSINYSPTYITHLIHVF